MSTPAISSIAESLETIAFSFESASAPSAIVTEKTAGMATGMEATISTSTNCRMRERVRHAPIIGDDEIAIDLDRDQHDRERNGDDDEKIADLEHGLLRMAHRSGAGDEARRAAEESVGAVAVTTPIISPCLTMLPEKAASPGFLATGSDSPVSAAWSIEA